LKNAGFQLAIANCQWSIVNKRLIRARGAQNLRSKTLRCGVSSSHPEPERLKAFGLGQLPAAQAAPIQQHISACATCCQALATVADDKLVALLRPSPETAWWPGAAQSQPAKGFVAPPELANHPRYRLLEILGQGGMGTVYKAEHRLMNRLVAIKVVRDRLFEKPAVRERFLRELQTAGKLAHPNLVAAHDAEQAGDCCFLVMEYVPGESLADLVKVRGPLPIAQACAYVRQAALGLQYAHERGLVHRDIKPGNLMRTPEGIVKVLDFGLARFTLEHAAEQTAADAILGTPAYMAPEQARNARGADIRADIYGLGGTLVYLLTGHPPAGVSTLAEVSDVPANLLQVIKKMLARNAADRFQTPAEVALALSPFAGAVGQDSDPAAAKRQDRNPAPQASATVRPATTVRSRGRLIAWTAGLAAAAGLLILLGSIFLRDGNQPVKPVVSKNFAPQKADEVRRWLGHTYKIASISLVPDLRRFLTGSFGELYLWDLDKDAEVWHSGRFEVQGWMHGVALCADGSSALAGGQGGTVQLWDVAKGIRLGKPLSAESTVQSLALAADGKHFAFTTQAGFGRLCTIEPLKEIGRFVGNPVAFAADGRTFVTGHEKSLYIWDAQKPSAKELRRYPGPARRIASLAVSQDGKRALTGEDWNPDGQAFLWDLADGKTTALTGHKNVKAVALTPDGRLALTGDAAGVLRLWDATTAKMLLQWEGHDGPVSALAIMPDGRLVLSGGEDKIIRLWSMTE
jgi:tRNA A-37 threonylcarbamoyl transferase component Bud32